MAKEFYVYELRDESGKPFYVGKGSGGRAHQHTRKARRLKTSCSPVLVRIRQILASGGRVDSVIVFRTDDEQEAFNRERDLIAWYGVHNLCNCTLGGDGPLGMCQEARDKIAAMRRGRKASEATRAKQRAAKLGTHRSEETKRKIAASQTGTKKPWARAVGKANAHIRPFLGRKHTPETIAKMRAAKLGHVVTEETRRKISQSKRKKGSE